MMKTIAVLGATGQQGGSIARELLSKKEWKVRAITRNADSAGAKALASAGAEVVVADTNDVDSLIKAFQGVQAIYAVTNFWEHLASGSSQVEAGEKEAQQAMNIANAAAKTSTLEHYIYHTLPSMSSATKGRITVPHFDYKATVDERIRKELPALAALTTFFWVGWYPSNMVSLPMFKPISTGGKHFWFVPGNPKFKIPVAGDIGTMPGIFARQVLRNPEKTRQGKYVNVSTETLDWEQISHIWSEVAGEPLVNVEVSGATFSDMWGIFGAELADQYRFGEVDEWTSLLGDKYVTPEAIGIAKSDMVGLKQAFEKLKPQLL